MLLCFLYVLFCILGIIKGCTCVVVDLNEICSLLVHFCVDLLGYVIDVRHELLHVVQFILTLLDEIVHVGCLTLNPQLINVELLLLQKLLILFVSV